MVTSNGSSPLTVRGLDPGIMYSVTINVFNGNQVVLSDQMVIKTITVVNDESGNLHNIYILYIRICSYYVHNVYIKHTDNVHRYVHKYDFLCKNCP